MRRSLECIGKAVHWLSWPVLCLYVRGSRRTRILIRHKDDVLLVRGWYGSGEWDLPGGGLHHNENPRSGALRELKEETSVVISAKLLQPLFNRQVGTYGCKYQVFAFTAAVSSRPDIIRQKFEIAEARWMSWNELLKNPKVSQTTKLVVRAFYDPKNLLQ